MNISIDLRKKNGINLSKKTNNIDLIKGNIKIQDVVIGVNWGKIRHTKKVNRQEKVYKGKSEAKLSNLFGLLSKDEYEYKTVTDEKVVSYEDVDLDISVVMFDKNMKKLDTVYYKKLRSNDKAIKHSGDDLVGDKEDDGLDNEVISINLLKVHPTVDSIYFIINSYSGQKFDRLPYIKTRIYEGSTDKINDVLATYNLENSDSDNNFKGSRGNILGKLVRNSNHTWSFKTIGQATKRNMLGEIVNEIK